MNPNVREFLVKEFGLAEDADEATAKSMLREKLASGDLSDEKYLQLIQTKDQSADKANELAEKIADKVGSQIKGSLDGISGGFTDLSKGLNDLVGTLKEQKQPEAPKAPEVPKAEEKSWEDQEKALIEKMRKEFGPKQEEKKDTDTLMKMAFEDSKDERAIRVKAHVERWNDTRTALVHKSDNSKRMGVFQRPMTVNGMEVDELNERSKNMTAVWLKFQVQPENLKEWEQEVIQYILHKEAFVVPGEERARNLTESERQSVWNHNKTFYDGRGTKAVIDDSTSGGENAIPEFFDYNLIVTPTLAQENLMSYCDVVMVPRGVAAQNFTMGRPTFAAATAEGTGNEVSLFSTTGFVANHDTNFFRAAGFIELGLNFMEDASPRMLPEIQNQYMETSQLWFNEQITNGDGTTEPQGIKNDTGTADITPANPTTGAATIGDYINLYFGVNKAYRQKGGLQNACYIMTDQTYKRARSIATGVTGDSRLVFGQSIGDYMLFGQPVLIEENGMSNNDVIFAQMKGYRLYLRQGLRFIRETTGKSLVTANSMLIGADVRAGGQLSLPGFAAVSDAFQA